MTRLSRRSSPWRISRTCNRLPDVNKRTARLGANIPLIKNRLCPLSFIDVPEKDYIEGEPGRVRINADQPVAGRVRVGIRAILSAIQSHQGPHSQPGPVPAETQALALSGDRPDRQRASLKPPMRALRNWRRAVSRTVTPKRFISLVNEELQILHHGNLGRYRISLDEFKAWRQG